ncbi:MAG: hypothetical protein R6X17_00050 [Candidatus Competibacteraceae bacterium]
MVTERVAMQGRTLRWLVGRIDPTRPYYLLGEVEMADARAQARVALLSSIETYNPAAYRGGILTLHYARAREIDPWLDLWVGPAGWYRLGGQDHGTQNLMLQTNWQIYDHYGYALIAVIGTLAVAVAIQWLIQGSRWAPWTRSLQGVAPPFINIIGVLFALTLAFLANDTWDAHDRAMKAVYQEANALHGIATLSAQLPEPLSGLLRETLAAYAVASAGEWPFLARRAASPEVVDRADALLRLLASREVRQAAGGHVQALLLGKANEIRDQRDQRIALSRTHVNPLKWMGMAFLGLLTLLSVAVVHVDRPRAALVAIVLFALAAAPTAAIVLIQGNPFQPPTAVTPAPIEAAVAGALGLDHHPE